MSLAERLRGIVKPVGAPPPAGRYLDTAGGSGMEGCLGGSWREVPGGRVFAVDHAYGSTARCGRASVASLAGSLHARASEAAVLAGSAAPAPFVFFDLETTGLSGGAGTFAFLVGCGWFDSDTFLTRQYLLTSFGDERAMLGSIASHLNGAGALVSFNGKSFDTPVLETRYLFHRLPWSPRHLAHLDVLHPARHFWGGLHSDGCSLSTLERELFGATRHGDIPGFEIPARYFHFIRSGEPSILAPILEHNRRDLLSLAAVCARALELVAAGGAAVGEPREALALGKLYQRAGREPDARVAFERAVALTDNRGLRFALIRVESLRALAVADRRARRYADAAAWWRRLLDTPGCPRVAAREAHEALAIHHEHRARNLPAARSFTLKTLEAAATLGKSRQENASHRLARLDRKLAALAPLPGLEETDQV